MEGMGVQYRLYETASLGLIIIVMLHTLSTSVYVCVFMLLAEYMRACVYVWLSMHVLIISISLKVKNHYLKFNLFFSFFLFFFLLLLFIFVKI